MYKNVLVPLDGSKLAEVVLPYASQLANSLRLKVTFLHVCSTGESPSAFMCRVYVDHIVEISGIKSNGAEALGEVANGTPAEVILQFAREGNYDLVLMATHGRSGIGRWVMGSVAHKVLSATPEPVILIRAGAEAALSPDWPRNILVPLDGSTYAEAVLPHLETLVKQRANPVKITLLRVCEPADILSDYPEAIMPLTWEQHVKQATATSEKSCRVYLDKVDEQLGKAGINVMVDTLLGEKPTQEIIGYSKKNSFDLIAMSTHGRSGSTILPFGHVAGQLMHSVLTPLFLVRPLNPTEIG